MSKTTSATVITNRERTETTRLALLDAARALFVGKGYGDTSTPEIAVAAGITRGALYHHFADKKALFEALVIQLQADATEKIKAKAKRATTAQERMRAGSLAFLDACMEPSYRRLVIEEAPAVLGTARCREIEEAYAFGLLIAAVSAQQASGAFKTDNAYLAARMVGTMMCEAALLLGDAKRPAEMKRQAVATVERVLAAFEAA